MAKLFKLILSIPKSIYFNFRYLPLRQAIKLPIFVDSSVRLLKCRGTIFLNFAPSAFCIKIGGSDEVILNKKGNGLRWKVEGDVIFSGPAKINYGCGISVERGAVLKLGEYAFINVGALLICTKLIEFGRHVSISWNCTFCDSDFHDIVDIANNTVVNPDEPISIGDFVWIGYDSKIRKGVSIARWNIIGANSVVTKSISGEKQIWAGSPAKLIKEGYYRPSLNPSNKTLKLYR